MAQINSEIPQHVVDYYNQIQDNVQYALSIANQARSIGLDPSKSVEIFIAEDVASRTEGLVGPPGISKILRKMEENLSKDEIVLQIAKEIAGGKIIKGHPEELAEQALRTALSYQTEGITAAPIEGIGNVAIKSNPDNTQYLAVYFSGPIRSAGGTAQGVSVFLADIIRQELGLASYKPTLDECNRMLEEVRLYNRIMHLQLPTTDDELLFAWKNLPIMITGDPTEKEEVSGYRNLDSMETNRVRGGACLVLNDGLIGRAKKIMKRISKLKISGWEWLNEIAKGKFREVLAVSADNSEKKKVMPDFSFFSDALMGRPTFAGPTSKGGFRLRYGHARNTGIAGIGIHPGTMALVNDYLASGTHIRTERPGKGSIVTPVDSIRGPIVKLTSGEVLEVNDYESGVAVRDKVREILFLGDLLIGYGEFVQNNYILCPPGYCEEWWFQELRSKGFENSGFDFINVSWHTVKEISEKYDIPLHPKFTPAWNNINAKDIVVLHEWLYTKERSNVHKIKTLMENLLIPHKFEDQVVIDPDFEASLKFQIPRESKTNIKLIEPLDLINLTSPVQIKDIMGTTIGARMGRPEKAKHRKMKPALHGLFPLGKTRKISRSLSKLKQFEELSIHMANRFCIKCQKKGYKTFCENCRLETELIGKCTNCKATMDSSPCDLCGSRVNYLAFHNISVQSLFNQIHNRLGNIGDIEAKFKDNIRNPQGSVETIEKGILRAKYDLHVFRDGTIRFDSTDAPLTHFYPSEISTSIESLIDLGYTQDIHGEPLVDQHQLLELKIQDIILSDSAIHHLIKTSTFVDDELEMLYNLPKFYEAQSPEDLIGLLVIGLAPHTSAGVIGRVVGFNSSSVCWAHPYWHSAKRRNCDGDEDGVILLMDGFLNFSKTYLPTSRGSKMDTPLVLVSNLNPSEVDDEALNLDCSLVYPLNFYEEASQMKHPNDILDLIPRLEDRLGTKEIYQNFYFTHSTRSISIGPSFSRYKNPNLTIRDKLQDQLELAQIIKAVDAKEIARNVLEKHVLPDLIGNLRAYGSQEIRCVTCNTKYRRIPLSATCRNLDCPKSNLILTVPPKGVTKYLDICKMLIEDFNLGTYQNDRLTRILLAVESQASVSDEKQLNLADWFE